VKKLLKFPKRRYPKKLRSALQLVQHNSQPPLGRLRSIGGLSFSATSYRRLLQQLGKIGLKPDKHGNIFFDVTTKNAEACLKIHINRQTQPRKQSVTIELLTATPNLTPETKRKTRQILRALHAVSGDNFNQFASWILE